MKIIQFHSEPVHIFPFLNAGRGPGSFFEDRLPIHIAHVDRLPAGLAAIVATADLQGRERFEDAPGSTIRLLGEAIPRRLVDEVLSTMLLEKSGQVGVVLAGDFYTVPALDKRGGTGDVVGVWRAFSNCFDWVAGVAGNHDLFFDPPQRQPQLGSKIRYLDGNATEVGGLRIAGLGGIIGNIRNPHRRSEDDYMAELKKLVQLRPDLLLMHDGPNGVEPGQRGLSRATEILLKSNVGMVIRGHAHWDQPFAEFASGLQVLNVDARVVVLTE